MQPAQTCNLDGSFRTMDRERFGSTETSEAKTQEVKLLQNIDQPEPTEPKLVPVEKFIVQFLPGTRHLFAFKLL